MLSYVNIGCSAIVSALQFHYSIITLHNDVECVDVKSSSQCSMLMICSSVIKATAFYIKLVNWWDFWALMLLHWTLVQIWHSQFIKLSKCLQNVIMRAQKSHQLPHLMWDAVSLITNRAWELRSLLHTEHSHYQSASSHRISRAIPLKSGQLPSQNLQILTNR